MIKPYRFDLYPTTEQDTLICKPIGCVRFIYNQMPAKRTANSEKDQADTKRPKRRKYRTLAAFKTELDWLHESQIRGRRGE